MRVKTLRSRFTVNDLARLRVQGAVPAGPAPMASRGGPGSRSSRTVFEVERTVARNGTVSLGNQTVLAAEILAGRRVGIYVEEGAPLLFFDLETRELLRSRPNPLHPGDAARLQQSRPVGPLPRPSTEPVTVQRRVASNGCWHACITRSRASMRHQQTSGELLTYRIVVGLTPDFNSYGQRNGDDRLDVATTRLLEAG